MPRLSLFIAPGLLGGVSCNDAIMRSGVPIFGWGSWLAEVKRTFGAGDAQCHQLA